MANVIYYSINLANAQDEMIVNLMKFFLRDNLEPLALKIVPTWHELLRKKIDYGNISDLETTKTLLLELADKLNSYNYITFQTNQELMFFYIVLLNMHEIFGQWQEEPYISFRKYAEEHLSRMKRISGF